MGGRVPRTQRPRVRPGEEWAPSGCTLPKTHNAMTTHNHTIPDRSPLGSTRTAPSAVHQARRCQVCYWCTIEDSRKRQHHHRHLEHKDTNSYRETSGTNTRNGQVQMEHPWTLLNEMEELLRNNNKGRKQGFFFPVEQRINTSMALAFLFTRTS